MDISKIQRWLPGRYMFEEGERQLELSRIAGGIVLPSGTKPGFACLLAVESFLSVGFFCRRMHALTEIEEYDLEGLIRQCLNLSHKLQLHDWWGHPSENSMAVLHIFNRQQFAGGRPQFNLMASPMLRKENATDCFRYALGRIGERTLPGKKTLELTATPKIQAALTMLPPESANGQEIENYPSVAALCFVVAALDIYETPEAGTEQTTTLNDGPLFWNSRRGKDRKDIYGDTEH